jgi:hypothetical protein
MGISSNSRSDGATLISALESVRLIDAFARLPMK